MTDNKKMTGGRWLGLAVAVAALAGGGWWWSKSQTDAGGADKAAGDGKGAVAAGPVGPGGAGGPGGPGGPGGRRNMPVPAVIDQVRAGDVPVIVTAIGTVTARSTAAARARVDGLLQGVSFREGQLVRAGDVIAQIDALPFQAALQQAQGQLAKDQAQLDSAKLDLVRYQKLLEQDSIARQQVEAQAALVKQLEGTLQADRAQVATAQLNVGYTQVKAPISGRTGLRQVDAGNMVRASDTNGIVIITEVQPITAVFAVPQEVLPSVLARLTAKTVEERLKVQAIDRDGRTVLDAGELLAVDNQIDAATGTVKLKAVFPNKSNRLFPNQFVNAKLELEQLDGALTVPQSAVQRGAPGTYVYVVTPEKTASLRKVQLGVVSGDRVVISSGLKEGEAIVIDGADKLRDGAPVTTVQAPPPVRTRQRGEGKQGDGKGAAPTAGASAPSSAAPGAPATAAAGSDASKKSWTDLSDAEKAERRKQREAAGGAPGGAPAAAPATAGAAGDAPRKSWADLSDAEKAERRKQREAAGGAPGGAGKP